MGHHIHPLYFTRVAQRTCNFHTTSMHSLQSYRHKHTIKVGLQRCKNYYGQFCKVARNLWAKWLFIPHHHSTAQRSTKHERATSTDTSMCLDIESLLWVAMLLHEGGRCAQGCACHEPASHDSAILANQIFEFHGMLFQTGKGSPTSKLQELQEAWQCLA